MKVSVAIPVYNRAHKILGTIDSILSQTQPVDEIVICDDGSDDNLEHVISGYSPLVKVIRIDNSGPANARRIAIEMCSNEWIALCDSDDFWLSTHIENFKEATQINGFDLYVSNFVHNKESLSKLEFAPNEMIHKFSERKFHTFSADNLFPMLLNYQFCFQSCMIFKKTAYDAIGGIDKNYSRWLSEDLHFTLRLVSKVNTCVCSTPTVTITKDDDNFSGNFIKTLAGEVDILEVLINSSIFTSEQEKLLIIEFNKRKNELFNQYYWYGHPNEALNCYKSLSLPKKIGIRNILKAIVSYVKT
jgi:glycosyltransferase involved in cell wall biosynthesis